MLWVPGNTALTRTGQDQWHEVMSGKGNYGGPQMALPCLQESHHIQELEMPPQFCLWDFQTKVCLAGKFSLIMLDRLVKGDQQAPASKHGDDMTGICLGMDMAIFGILSQHLK